MTDYIEQLGFGFACEETTANKIIQAVLLALPSVSKEHLRVYAIDGSAGLTRIQMDTEATLYRPEQSGVTLLSFKEGSKVQYARLAARYAPLLRAAGIEYKTEGNKKDFSFVRVLLDDFLAACSAGTLSGLFVEMIKYSIGAASFGCCHLCEHCSDAGRCLHEDQLYALACQYKSHLDAGRIFYGKNAKCR